MSETAIPIVTVSTSELEGFVQDQPDNIQAWLKSHGFSGKSGELCLCLLYTSDAADDDYTV